MVANSNVESAHPEWNTPDNPDRSPRNLGWQWIIQGVRERWWLEVTDDRPPINGRPYRLDPQDDAQFFAWAQDKGLTMPDKIRFCITTLVTYMDEKLMGQSTAAEAYDHGAMNDDPPWVHTHYHTH